MGALHDICLSLHHQICEGYFLFCVLVLAHRKNIYIYILENVQFHGVPNALESTILYSFAARQGMGGRPRSHGIID